MVVLAGSLLTSTAAVLSLVSQTANATTTTTRPPIVNTGYTSQLTSSSVTLSGSITPNGGTISYYFQYGPTQSYGAQTPTAPLGSGAETIHVSAPITGLAANTTYHYRLIANGQAGAVMGADRSFTTVKLPVAQTSPPKTPVSIAIDPIHPVIFGEPVHVQGTLGGTGSGDHRVAVQTNSFPYLTGFSYNGASQLTTGTGQFSFTLSGLTRSVQVRIVAAGVPQTASPIVTAQIAVRVVAHARHARRHGFVHIYGNVSPSTAPPLTGARVILERLIRGSHFAPVRNGGTVVTNDSQFGRIVRIRRSGIYRVFVQVPNDGLTSNGSQPMRITK